MDQKTLSYLGGLLAFHLALLGGGVEVAAQGAVPVKPVEATLLPPIPPQPRGALGRAAPPQEAPPVKAGIDPALCQQLLIRYKAPTDSLLRPEIDNAGRAVVPADLTPPQNYGIGQGQDFPLKLDISKFLNNAAPFGVSADYDVARIRIDSAGAVRLNDQPIGEGDMAALTALCKETQGTAEDAAKTPIVP
jgi:hypothetical protein